MKKLNSNLILFVVISKLVSCSNPQSARIERDLIKSNYDSLTIIHPEIYRTDPSLKRVEEKRSRTLGLNRIETGVLDPELRIWEDLSAVSGHVFIINYKKGNWTAYKYDFNYHASIGFFPDSLAGKRIQLGVPQSGWPQFLNKLLDLQILVLPSYESFSNYNVPADELFVRVEISKKNYYRRYEYPNPYKHQDIPSAKKMVQILQLLKEEFCARPGSCPEANSNNHECCGQTPGYELHQGFNDMSSKP